MNTFRDVSGVRIYCGDTLAVLPTLPAKSVRCCVTSPPYWGLRDYGCDGQLGLEPTPGEYVAKMVAVFREVRRVLTDDGTLWLNLGDSYATGGIGRRDGGTNGGLGQQGGNKIGSGSPGYYRQRPPIEGVKPKDLVGIPWRVAFALQADGWYLRQDIIWSKPNPMPESVTDRCTKAHEYVFLLSKSARYFYDAEAIAEPVSGSTVARMSQPTLDQQAGSNRVPGKTNGPMKAVTKRSGNKAKYSPGHPTDDKPYCGIPWEGSDRNRRSVWTITTQPFSGAHFAVMPKALVEPCIKAGSKPGDMILDPFGGSGTVAEVALRLNRRATLIELNPEYVTIQTDRLNRVLGTGPGQMFADVA